MLIPLCDMLINTDAIILIRHTCSDEYPYLLSTAFADLQLNEEQYTLVTEAMGIYAPPKPATNLLQEVKAAIVSCPTPEVAVAAVTPAQCHRKKQIRKIVREENNDS